MRLSKILSLLPTPVFALMTGVGLASDANPAASLCSALGFEAIGEMTLMYALMSCFHAAPWLQLLENGGPSDPPVAMRRWKT